MIFLPFSSVFPQTSCSYYDFIDRLWLRDAAKDRKDSKKLYPFPKNKKPSSKPGKGEKLPNKHPDIVAKCIDFASSGKDFPFHYEKLLQELFPLIAVVPSLELGLIPDSPLTVAGDGTCVHCHSNPLGRKVCKCRESGIYNCKCDRRYPAFDASYGWDSDLNTWFYGYTLYTLSTYNKELHIDLPLHLRFLDTRRHDSVSEIVALHEIHLLNPLLNIQNLCLDSAHDNYPTYQPGYKMVYWGLSSIRKRYKWRCPLKCGKVDECSCQSSCSPSNYGRVIYTKPDWDIRLYPSVPRGTKQFKETYNTRTCSERINNRILNDYHLHDNRHQYTFRCPHKES